MLLTIPEVADELRVHRSTVYRMLTARELATVEVRGKRRVRRSDLERYVAGLPVVAED